MPARTKSRSTPVPAKIGRPTKYSDEWAEKFCQEIAKGSYIAEICKRSDQPSRETVYSWLIARAEFSDMYVRAREARADALAEKAMKIVDDVEPEAGKIAKARLQFDAYRWHAAKLAPRKYGDHIDHDVRGSTTLNYQPAILIKVGDGTTTRSEDAPAPKAGRGVLLNGNGDIVRER